MRVLVTGAAGFVGSRISEELANEGHQVYGVDNLSSGKQENVAEGVKFSQLDLKNETETERTLSYIKPEVVYHFAALPYERLGQRMPRQVIENNISASGNLLTSSIRAGVDRFVFASSAGVYGDSTPPFREDMPLEPIDVYSASKASVEWITRSLALDYDLDYSILRLYNIYGPGMDFSDPHRNVVGIFINKALRDEPITIFGDGEQTRAFSYLKDLTPAIIKAGIINEARNEVFNLGGVESVSMNQLSEGIFKALGKEANVTYLPLPTNEVKEVYCDITKAREVLGFEPRTTFEEGIRRTSEWARRIGAKEFETQFKADIESDSITSREREK